MKLEPAVVDDRATRVRRVICFLAVGASGLIVDVAAFRLLSEVAAIGVSRGLAIWLAMSWNFMLNRRLTFERISDASTSRQYVRFCGACIVGAIFNWTSSLLLLQISGWFSRHMYLAAAIGACVGAGANYVLCCRWVFRRRHPSEPSNEIASAAPRQAPTYKSRRAA